MKLKLADKEQIVRGDPDQFYQVSNNNEIG
jgi:hypothetical protein